MALHRGYTRYAFSIQYHGSSFLGFAHHRKQENSILTDGTDLRGFYSVEGRLRQALDEMIGNAYENIQVSSRTDRGVHAFKNTCHVDIKERSNGQQKRLWEPDVLQRGLNSYLSQQGGEEESDHQRFLDRRAKRKRDNWSFHRPMNELRILKMIQAPLQMKNKFHFTDHTNQIPEYVDWNVRFSANQRTYIYRLLACAGQTAEWALPFEWDRSWRISPTKDSPREGPLDIHAMKEAAAYLVGTHDFSSFRAAGCQRASPIVTIKEIQVYCQAYGEPLLWNSTGGLLGVGDQDCNNALPQLVSVKVVGNSFVYHQVRNIVGALVAVGRRSLSPRELRDILEAKDRTQAPATAPPHGLFLADVRHDDIVL